MTFTGTTLRTDKKLLLRFEKVTAENLLQFRVLSGFNWAYGVMRGAVETSQVLFFENSETLTNLIKQKNDIVHLFGEFNILENYTVNIVSLNTCYYFEFFMWQTMPSKLILNV